MKALLPLLLLGACGTPPSGVREVQYTVVWDPAGTTLEEGARVLHTDLGYEVRLTRLLVVEHTVSLVPCVDRSTALLGWPVATAWAAHPASDDPSSLVATRAVDALDPSPVTLGTTHPGGEAYCGAHWVVADAPPGSPHAGHSLVVEGSWRKGDRAGTLAWTSAWPQGRSTPIDLGALGTDRVAVTVTRRLATILDGVDLATARDLEGLWQVLVHLVDDTTVRVDAAR
ncbi:MAG: hypothetical protein H6732_18650 [Alphaproteobacteria bacterium]|nr:hypothetical protein [Alphaproteobacteria bacterium]